MNVMGFAVEPGVLRDFQKMLERNSEIAQDICLYPDTSYQLLAGGAIYEEISEFHDRVVERADARMSLVRDRLFWSAYGMDQTVQFYESTDHANAERLDRSYPAVEGAPPPPEPPAESPAVPTFTATYPDEHLKVAVEDLDAGDLEPITTTLEFGLKKLGEYLSIYYWIKQGLGAIGCGDPFGDMIRVYSGDWKVWARTAKMWLNCGYAYQVVAANVGQHRDLAYFWQGNAADAAHVYFGKATAGIDAEYAFHEFAYAKYRDIVEVVHDSFEACDFILGLIIDTFLTLGLGAIVKLGARAAFIKELVDAIGQIISGTNAAILAIKSEPFDGSGSEPPCPLADLAPAAEGRTNGYRHPEEKE